MNFSMQDIASSATNAATFQRGVEYFNQHRVSKLHTSLSEETGGTKITADVRGGKYSYEVEINFDEKGSIAEKWCDCPAFYEYDGCCKHIVAVLTAYYNIQKTKVSDGAPPDTKTDNFAHLMISRYAKRARDDALAQVAISKARLEPSIGFDYKENLNISLNVGVERMYIVKDLGKFYSDMEQGNTVKYGAKLTLIHTPGAFDERSRPLLRFFMDRYREAEQFRGALGYYMPRSNKRALDLSQSAFDEFFEIMLGQQVKIEYNYNNGTQALFVDGNPDLSLEVQDLEQQAFQLRLKRPPQLLIFGQKREYVLLDGKLYRCDEKYTAATREFLHAAVGKSAGLIVNNRDMGSLCANVLGEIGDFIKIDAQGGSLAQYEPEPLVAKLYLDMPSQTVVTASLKYVYGKAEIDSMDEDADTKVRRDYKGEYVARTIVDKYIGKYDIKNRLLYVDDEDKIYSLLSDGIREISAAAEVYTTDRLKRVTIRRPPAVSVGVRLKSDLLDVHIDTGEFPTEELVGLLQSYRQHKKYHKLRDGSFVDLQGGALDELSELVDGLDLSKEDLKTGNASVRKYRAMYIDSILRNSELLQSERDTGFKAMLRELHDTDDSDVQPPACLKGVLRNYQKKGFRWLKSMSRYGFGGILADDMGLGKTVEAIAYMQSEKDESEGPVAFLVVCPTSLVLNWESEIHKFTPGLKPLPITGGAEQRTQLMRDAGDYDVIITSYDTLKRDIGLYRGLSFNCVIIDEAQYIKNAVTQNARAVKSVNSKNRFALTGTPVENSLAELWSIFDFLMPGYLYTHAKFKAEFETPIVKSGDEKAMARLRQLLSPFILRRLKSSVLKELPPKTESVLYAELTDEQRKLYFANLASIRTQLATSLQRPGANKLIVLAMLTRLRQICCDPSLYYEDYHGESAKLKMCMELLITSTQSGHKVLLFSQFTSMLAIIASRLEQEGIGYFLLRGSTPKEERSRLVTRFNSPAEPTQIFLISLKAGGTGLNLTAADIVIHYDPWWNVSAQNQATDRAHRIGQDKSVQVYKLIAKDTIEEKILKLQQDKLRLADSVITEGDDILSRMSQQELLALFNE